LTFEEFHFLRGRCAAQDGVTVWEATEPVDDVLVGLRVFCQLRIAQGRNELHASGLSIDILLMFERQIEEQSPVAAERARRALGDGRPGNGERLGVVGECAGVPRNMLREN
jgi:hypothetical protein